MTVIAAGRVGGASGDITVTKVDVDNLRLDGNTISSTDTNGNIVLDPNGTGAVVVRVADGSIGTLNSGNEQKAAIGNADWGLSSDTHVRFFNDPDIASGSADVGLKRSAAGKLRGTNGSTGDLVALLFTSSVGIFQGTGSPEGAVTAGIGSLFMRTDGGAATSLYVKESGAGNTGWVAK